MAIEEVKLYVLYKVRDSGATAQVVAGSHSLGKLEQLGHSSVWTIVSDPISPMLKRKSGDDYPKFLIYEEPFVS